MSFFPNIIEELRAVRLVQKYRFSSLDEGLLVCVCVYVHLMMCITGRLKRRFFIVQSPFLTFTDVIECIKVLVVYSFTKKGMKSLAEERR